MTGGRGYDVITSQPGFLLLQRYGYTDPVRMVPLEDGTLAIEGKKSRAEFLLHEGSLLMLTRYAGERTIYAQKYDAPSPPEAWISRLGTYCIANLNPRDMGHFVPEDLRPASSVMELAQEDGLLILKTGLGCFVVDAQDDATGVFFGLGQDNGVTLTADESTDPIRLAFLDVEYEKCEEAAAAPALRNNVNWPLPERP